MPTVAIAGGTGSIGRTILEAVVADGKFSAFVLSRKVRSLKVFDKTYSLTLVVD